MRADARRNRHRVLEAAEAVFASEGASVPIDEIARRAGVGAGTVYRHFPTKEALFEAIVVGRVGQLIDHARSLRNADDPGAAFFGFLSRMVEEGTAKRDLFDALAEAGFDAQVAISEAARDLGEVIAELLARAQHAGMVRDDVGIADVMALVTGVSLFMRARHGHGGDGVSPGRLLTIMCDGLRPTAAVDSRMTTS